MGLVLAREVLFLQGTRLLLQPWYLTPSNNPGHTAIDWPMTQLFSEADKSQYTEVSLWKSKRN